MTTCWHPEYRLAFIHIPKCAGTSIGGRYDARTGKWTESWLQEALPGWTREGFPIGHQPVQSILPLLGHPLDWWKKILVPIRNPFAQQVSQFKFWRARGKRQAHEGLGVHPDDLFASSVSFKQFVLDPRSNGPNALCGDRWREVGGVYRWWCCDEWGRIPPNVYIFRIEDLPDPLCHILGLDEAPAIPQINTTNGDPWQRYYDRETAEIVAAKFSWSLATFYPELTRLDFLHNLGADVEPSPSLV